MTKILAFPSPSTESADMSDKQSPPLNIIDLGTDKNIGDIAVQIREHGPLTLAKLARFVWTNTNYRITKEDRGQLHEFLKQHASAGGWENPKGKTWRMVDYVKPSTPVQGQLPGPGMTPDFEDAEIAKLALAWSVSSLARSDAQSAERASLVALNELLHTRMQEDGERRIFHCLKASGKTATVTYKHTPGKDGAAFDVVKPDLEDS